MLSQLVYIVCSPEIEASSACPWERWCRTRTHALSSPPSCWSTAGDACPPQLAEHRLEVLYRYYIATICVYRPQSGRESRREPRLTPSSTEFDVRTNGCTSLTTTTKLKRTRRQTAVEDSIQPRATRVMCPYASWLERSEADRRSQCMWQPAPASTHAVRARLFASARDAMNGRVVPACITGSSCTGSSWYRYSS